MISFEIVVCIKRRVIEHKLHHLKQIVLKDIKVGRVSYPYPSNLAVSDSTLYFVANDGINGVELWKSDGTEGGTEPVTVIRSLGDSGVFGLNDN